MVYEANKTFSVSFADNVICTYGKPYLSLHIISFSRKTNIYFHVSMGGKDMLIILIDNGSGNENKQSRHI